MKVRIVPVIDLKGGMAVHAIGGRRDQYRPLRSVWQGSPCPVALAASLFDGLGIDRLYVADLDAIGGLPPALLVHDRLSRLGPELWLDAGVRDIEALGPLRGLRSDRVRIIVGLESVGGPSRLREIIDQAGRDRVAFSLDLDDGVPRVARGATWGERDPLEIITEAVGVGVGRLILLDLRRVGTDRGIGTEGLLSAIRARHADLEITVGGGIRGMADVRGASERGASAVLVGSAIHDGRIGRLEIDDLTNGPAGIG